MRRATATATPLTPAEASEDHLVRRAEAERLAQAAVIKLTVLLAAHYLPAWNLMTVSRLPFPLIPIGTPKPFTSMNDVYAHFAHDIVWRATHGRTDAWYNPASALKVLTALFKSIGINAKL